MTNCINNSMGCTQFVTSSHGFRDKLKQADIDQLLFQACERLNEIYLAQLDSRDLSPGDQDIEVISSVLRPLRGGRRQGRGLNAADRGKQHSCPLRGFLNRRSRWIKQLQLRAERNPVLGALSMRPDRYDAVADPGFN